MGMFDYVIYETECPDCGSVIERFQTKTGDCLLKDLDYTEAFYFYGSCNFCKRWLEYILVEPETSKFRLLTTDECETVAVNNMFDLEPNIYAFYAVGEGNPKEYFPEAFFDNRVDAEYYESILKECKGYESCFTLPVLEWMIKYYD